MMGHPEPRRRRGTSQLQIAATVKINAYTDGERLS
jgi:hypothetical protein